MERMAIEVTFERRGKEIKVYCENLTITMTGWVAISYFDGGYNCVYRKEEFKGCKMVPKESLFSNMEEYLSWKNAFDM